MEIHTHRGSSRHCLSGISLGSFRMDPRHLPAGMTEMGRHLRHLSSGVHYSHENGETQEVNNSDVFCRVLTEGSVCYPSPPFISFKRSKLWIPALTPC